uniref:Uncharacterized protein n=1 Tax=Triticum urartu TaxID=4572 RepID=A0A8R7Q580_TRIUA
PPPPPRQPHTQSIFVFALLSLVSAQARSSLLSSSKPTQPWFHGVIPDPALARQVATRSLVRVLAPLGASIGWALLQIYLIGVSTKQCVRSLLHFSLLTVEEDFWVVHRRMGLDALMCVGLTQSGLHN